MNQARKEYLQTVSKSLRGVECDSESRSNHRDNSFPNPNFVYGLVGCLICLVVEWSANSCSLKSIRAQEQITLIYGDESSKEFQRLRIKGEDMLV